MTSVKPSGEVHAAAGLFPMLAADELAVLAADIKERGLQQPIVLLPDGMLLEGRNRLAACKKVRVRPEFVVYEGDDPWGYAIAANVHRRHLSAGQRAMVLAVYLVETGQRENGRFRPGALKGALSPDLENAPPSNRVSEAGFVLDHAPDLAEPVLAGALALAAAYRQTRELVEDAAGSEARLKALRLLDPALADQVAEEAISLDEAEQHAAREQRIATLPADLIERVRVESDALTLDEAELITREREQRLAVWAEKVDAAIEALARMAGSPVPEDLERRLADRSRRLLPSLLRSIERKEKS
jgi:ParB-like chromosome segregation protein Spo0J